MSRHDALVSVPGARPGTTLEFRSTIDDPNRFKNSGDVGAYPLSWTTPRYYQAGELDPTGRISKRGDHLTRRVGIKNAKTAVARKLAVVLHCVWVNGTEFQWGKEKA
jgi:transposase